MDLDHGYKVSIPNRNMVLIKYLYNLYGVIFSISNQFGLYSYQKNVYRLQFNFKSKWDRPT